MNRKLFAVLFAVGLLFAFAGMSMACGGGHDKVEFRTVTWTDSYPSDFNIVSTSDYAAAAADNAHGSFAVMAEANGMVSGYQSTTYETWQQEEKRTKKGGCCGGWSKWEPTGDAELVVTLVEPINDVNLCAKSGAFATGTLKWGSYTNHRSTFGKSWSTLDVDAEAWSRVSRPGPDGESSTYAHVAGEGYRNDSLLLNPRDGIIVTENGDTYDIDINEYAKGGVVIGGNYSGGSFEGEDFGDRRSCVKGGINAAGKTIGSIDIGYNSVDTFGMTKACSMAYQTGIGDVSVEGAGSIFALGALNKDIYGGSVSALTQGAADFGYSASGSNFAAGNGIAITNGSIDVSQGCNSLTVTSSSRSSASTGVVIGR